MILAERCDYDCSLASGGDAEFSPSGIYRHWLSREWGLRQYSDGREPFMLWIGMNPSTAEKDVDDPTIRREISFTRRMMINKYVKVNVMDYRATSPKELLKVAACSDQNLPIIKHFAEQAHSIVVCWGKLHKSLQHHADAVLEILNDRPLNCLGRNDDGSPKHPLYLANTTIFEKFCR